MAKKNPIYVITDLILDNTQYSTDDKVLMLSAKSLDVIEAIAKVAQSVGVYDHSYHQLQNVHTAVRQDNIQLYQDVYPQDVRPYDKAHIIVPKGRDVGRAMLWSAMHAVREGGRIYITGATKGGAKTLIKDAEVLFGNASVLGYKQSQRIAQINHNGAADYPAEWGQLPTELQHITLDTPHGTITVGTMAGVFSHGELDDGTEFLLKHTVLRGEQSVLDLGCGYGIIGATLAPMVAQVTMVDDDLLAVRCALATAEQQGLSNVTVQASHIYSTVRDTYDLIISNPPFHQGVDVSTTVSERMIRRAPNYLSRGGRMLIVANDFLKYEPIFDEHFADFRIVARNNKYKIIEGIV